MSSNGFEGGIPGILNGFQGVLLVLQGVSAERSRHVPLISESSGSVKESRGILKRSRCS